MTSKEATGRPRVYILLRRIGATTTRVFDLAYLGDQPIAVISWVRRDGQLTPGQYIKLDPNLLSSASLAGTFRYDGIVDEP